MSKALLRQALELVDSDCFTSGKESTNEKSVAKKKKGVKKQQIKLQTIGEKAKKRLQSVEAARRRLLISNDYTEENLQRLQLLSSATVDSLTTDQILERALRGKSRPTPNFIPLEKKKSKSETTAFTEEDFKKFESEYFVKK